MRPTIEIRHEGHVYYPFVPGEYWQSMWERWTDEEAEIYRRVISEGMFFRDGDQIPASESKRIRSTLLGTFRGLPGVSDPREVVVGRELIEGLWRWGTIPMLGGPPKVGKSVLMAELAAALIIPGRWFLGGFPPVQLSDEERRRDVWLINAENPPGLLHEALLGAGLFFGLSEDEYATPHYFHPDGEGRLIVEHLDNLGGPELFDVTDEGLHDLWASRLMRCPCLGIDDAAPPLVVIADGVTAMVGVERYFEWFRDFKRLMRELGIENAIAVGHTGLRTEHLYNGTEAMAGPDALWLYMLGSLDNYRSARYFSTVPRLGAPTVERSRVDQGEDGRLVIRRREESTDHAEANKEKAAPTGFDWDEDVRERLRVAGERGLLTSELTGSGRYGKLRRDALRRLHVAGEVTSKPEGQGKRWFLSDTA